MTPPGPPTIPGDGVFVRRGDVPGIHDGPAVAGIRPGGILAGRSRCQRRRRFDPPGFCSLIHQRFWPALPSGRILVVGILRGAAEQVMGAEGSRLAFLPEPEAFSPGVQHMVVVQQPGQNRRGDDGVAQQLTPLAEALAGSEDYAAPLLPGGDQGEEGGGRVPVVGPDA